MLPMRRGAGLDGSVRQTDIRYPPHVAHATRRMWCVVGAPLCAEAGLRQAGVHLHALPHSCNPLVSDMQRGSGYRGLGNAMRL